MFQISSQDYSAISNFLESQAGIRLGEGKEYLVSSRLIPILESYKIASFGQFVSQLKSTGNKQIQLKVIDAMTTNETFWFRDGAHYQALTESVLPDMAKSRVRVWSAAASTGQESFSIAISLQDAVQKGTLASSFSYEIMGTDISPSALVQAREARYCGMAASRGLSDLQRQQYFKTDNDCIEVLDNYKRDISFREFNLLENFSPLGKFDVIFCRNVLIYFSSERKEDILSRMADSLNPGGYLFIGSSESMHSSRELFEMKSLNGGLAYRKK